MKTIFLKIFTSFIFIILILSCIILFFSFDLIRENYTNTLIKQLINLDNSIKLEIKPYLINQKYDSLDSLIKIYGETVNTRITIIDTTGVVLADSKVNPKNMDNHIDRPEVQNALKAKEGHSLRHSYTVNKDMLYVAIPINFGDRNLGVSRVSIYLDEVDNLINQLRYGIFWIILVSLLISIVLAYIFSKSITNPIKKLVEMSKNIANGIFDKKIILNNKDEIRLLANSLNFMSDQLNHLFNEINNKKEELDKIISSLHEGLVVINNQQKIILCNKSFNEIIKNEYVIDKFIWEVTKDDDLRKIIKKKLSSENNILIEMQIFNNYYLCSINKINSNNETVLIFYDITKHKELENIKKEFIVNVSHELRTPLTVIKGYLELLEEDANNENKKYFDLINSHTNRLINIVNDLLTISKLEDKNSTIHLSNININELIENIKFTFQKKLSDSDLYFEIFISDNILYINADVFLLEQMFINLIDNSIKYTEIGGIKLFINLENNKINFVLEDTGIGISNKDCERIFERFYTVDKSRSHKVGGTGLGLSIVKHIVLMHQGTMKVESEIGVGTKFIIQIPVL